RLVEAVAVGNTVAVNGFAGLARALQRGASFLEDFLRYLVPVQAVGTDDARKKFRLVLGEMRRCAGAGLRLRTELDWARPRGILGCERRRIFLSTGSGAAS